METTLQFISMKFTFFALWLLRHKVEKIPSVQSLVDTSRVPNICGAVIAFGFILISLWRHKQSNQVNDKSIEYGFEPVWFSTLSHRFHQGVDTLCLSCTTWTQDHHSMTHSLGLKQLDDLQDPGGVEDEPGLVNLNLNKRSLDKLKQQRGKKTSKKIFAPGQHSSQNIAALATLCPLWPARESNPSNDINVLNNWANFSSW